MAHQIEETLSNSAENVDVPNVANRVEKATQTAPDVASIAASRANMLAAAAAADRRLSVPAFVYYNSPLRYSNSSARSAERIRGLSSVDSAAASDESEASRSESTGSESSNLGCRDADSVAIEVIVNEENNGPIERSQSPQQQLELQPAAGSTIQPTEHRQFRSLAVKSQPPRWHRHRHRHRHSVHSNDPAAGGCDSRDLCLLCDRCIAAPSGRSGGLDLTAAATEATIGGGAENDDDDASSDSSDATPRAVRWRKLPCDCRDRYLHQSCLETCFYEDAVYKRGHRQLLISCRSCRVQLRVRRQRGRRTCDRPAWLAFARHLACAGLVAGLLLAFGAWSMMTPEIVDSDSVALPRRPVTVVNAGLVAGGCLTLLVFTCLELWLMYARFEFAFDRVGTWATIGAATSADNGGFDEGEA